jgi:predicted P-loop ATPase/GTPase
VEIYLSAAIGAAGRVIVETLAGFAVPVQGAAGSRIVVARSPAADAVVILELARRLRIVERVLVRLEVLGR